METSQKATVEIEWKLLGAHPCPFERLVLGALKDTYPYADFKIKTIKHPEMIKGIAAVTNRKDK